MRATIQLPVLSLLLLPLLTGCGEPLELLDDVEVGTRQAAIVNGVVDTIHRDVGLLHSGGSSACTATQIGPHTLLTAAHCVTTPKAPYQLLSPVNYYPQGFGGSKIPAVAVTVHPDYAGTSRADIAVVRLGQPLAGTPARLAAVPPTEGESVELVGYGRTSETSADFGTRRRASSSVGQVEAGTMRFFGADASNGNLCNGDSGGPTFADRDGEQILIGVHSTKGGACGEEGNDVRVDAYLDWILAAASGDLPDQPDQPSQAGAPASTDQRSASACTSSERCPEPVGARDVEDSAMGCSLGGGHGAGSGSTLALVLVALAALGSCRRRGH